MSEKKHKSGIILVSVLWVIVILSMAAIALSHLSSGAMAMLDVSAGKIRAYAAARAGVVYVNDLLDHSKTSAIDTLFQCGVDLKGQKPEKLFQGIKVGDKAHFDITFVASGYLLDGSSAEVFGLEDEERRLNLNALNNGNSYVFSLLLQQFEVTALAADKIAASVVLWKDAGLSGGTTAGLNGGGSSIIFGDKYLKHRPFDVSEELLSVEGMTPEIYDKIKDFITVFPKSGELKVNLATASRPLIRALTGRVKQQDVVSEQLFRQRDGKDGIPFTEDDGLVGGVVLPPDDLEASKVLNYNTGVVSRYFRIHVTGVDEASGARTLVEAVVDTAADGGGSSLVAWRRE